MKLEIVADYACVIGENPLWHPVEQRLYWIDIPAGRMFRYDPASGQHEECYSGAVIGGVTLQADGALLLFMAQGAIKLWRDGRLTTVIDKIPNEETTRFNDVCADPQGRVFCGTMPTEERLGRLYRLDPDRTLTRLLDGIGCSNGIGFTPDRKHMYYTDSPQHQIYVFDYNEQTGAISNQHVFVQTPKGKGVPDGLTVDSEGYIWSARWDGYCLVRYAPDGTEDRTIDFPVKKVSSVCFGGPDYRSMYVTTAGGRRKSHEGAAAGALFHLDPGVSGLPEYTSRIGL